MDYMKNMNDMILSFRKFKEEIQTKLKTEFKKIISTLFEQNPKLNAIVWTQYTPYFMDGDPCVFSVGEVSFTNATGDDLNDISYGQYDGENEDVVCLSTYTSLDSTWIDEKTKVYAEEIDFNLCVQLGKLMESNEMEEVMLATFGDHVKVIATRDGFDIQEYDHD
jgi:hypothetical protein